MSDAFNIYVYAIEGGYEAEIRDAPNSSYIGFGATKVAAVLEVMKLAGEKDQDKLQCPRCGGMMAGDECSEPGCDYPDPQLTPEQEAERRADW